jgi:hypothetical protein
MANFFPRWSNFTPLKLAICLGAIGFGVTFVFAVYSGPQSQRVGYQPTQPIPYSHEIHVNQLGMDCRYCHSFVEHGAHANVPSANVCWNCHGPNKVKSDSPRLQPLRDAMVQNEDGENIGEPIEWVKIHKAPDYVYFNHSAHVNRGVSCESCHGNVNNMEVVHHDQPLTMGWCLDCHRSPEEHLRPIEEVTNLDYDVESYLEENPLTDEEGNLIKDEKGDPITTQNQFGAFLKAHWNVKPKESCATCHR